MRPSVSDLLHSLLITKLIIRLGYLRRLAVQNG